MSPNSRGVFRWLRAETESFPGGAIRHTLAPTTRSSEFVLGRSRSPKDPTRRSPRDAYEGYITDTTICETPSQRWCLFTISGIFMWSVRVISEQTYRPALCLFR